MARFVFDIFPDAAAFGQGFIAWILAPLAAAAAIVCSLQALFEELLTLDLAHRVLDFDSAAASQAAELALDLPVLYASGRAGVASMTQPADGSVPDGDNLDPFFDVLMEHVPAPKGDPEAPLQAQGAQQGRAGGGHRTARPTEGGTGNAWARLGGRSGGAAGCARCVRVLRRRG